MATKNELESVLGQDVVIANAKTLLQDPVCRAIVIEGPAGSGKTWIADEVAKSIPDTTPLFAAGDAVRRAEDFAPFEGLTRKLTGLEKMAVDGARVAVGAGSFLTGFGTLGSKVFDWAISASSALKSANAAEFSEEEWRWLGKLRRMSSGRPVVLVADNIHWWDLASFRFLEKLSESRDWKDHPFISDLKMIVVRTVDPSQTDHLNKPFKQWFERVRPPYVAVEKCSKKQFAEAIKSFGTDAKIAPRTLSELFSISAGNLKLAKLISAALSDGSSADDIATEAASVGLLRTLLAERFKSRDQKFESVLATLKSAALIGIYFYKSEATCLTSKDRDDDDVKIDLESAQATGLIEIDGEKYAFSHPVILDFVRRELSVGEIRALSEKLAYCLRLLRPSDYRRQVDLFVAGGDYKEAAQAAALHLIQKSRRHESIPDHVPPDHVQLLKKQGVLKLCEQLSAAYEKFGQGRFGSARADLEAIEEPLFSGLALELAYARALCNMESGRREDALDVSNVLETYLAATETEDFLEISTRMRLLRQQALVLAGDVEVARTNSIGLMSFLRKRAALDADAAMKYHQVLRKSNSIHDPFVAKTHLQQAVKFFQPGRPGELPEHPLEYYRSLVNLSGVEIQLGHWAEACEAANQAFELIAANTGFNFPRIDVALNNLNVARCRGKHDDIERSIEQQVIVVDHYQAISDNFQHRSNLVGMELLAGKLTEAEAVLQALEREFSAQGLSEQYITFHLQSHRQVLSYLLGDFEVCLEQHDQLTQLLGQIDWPSKSALLRRHEMMGEMIGERRSLLPDRFDKHFVELDSTGSGPSWPHFGRGVQFSELQFWSDS